MFLVGIKFDPHYGVNSGRYNSFIYQTKDQIIKIYLIQTRIFRSFVDLVTHQCLWPDQRKQLNDHFHLRFQIDIFPVDFQYRGL